MAVTPSLVPCPGGQWTLIASGAAYSVGFQFDRLAHGYVLPSASSSPPAARSASTPCWKIGSEREPVNLASDADTYWWFWHDGATPINLSVWSL